MFLMMPKKIRVQELLLGQNRRSLRVTARFGPWRRYCWLNLRRTRHRPQPVQLADRCVSICVMHVCYYMHKGVFACACIYLFYTMSWQVFFFSYLLSLLKKTKQEKGFSASSHQSDLINSVLVFSLIVTQKITMFDRRFRIWFWLWSNVTLPLLVMRFVIFFDLICSCFPNIEWVSSPCPSAKAADSSSACCTS